MNRQQLLEEKEREYKVLDSFKHNYKVEVRQLDAYAECHDRIRALNIQLESVND